MKNKKRFTIEELAEMEECPCPICSGQDEEGKIWSKVEIKALDEICDVFSNEIIDLVIENPSKYLLKPKTEGDKVK